jgi:hypothetical protein
MQIKRKYNTLLDVLNNTNRMRNGCMEWNGAINKDGYAACSAYGLFKSAALHREVFRLYSGETPKVVMHTCDNTKCINPTHLVAGTHQLNMQDRASKNRQAMGSKNGRAKLTEVQVRRIHKKRELGCSYAVLQALFGISRATVWRVLSGKNWGHVCK